MVSEPTIKGSCLCGSVTFDLSGGLGVNVMCLCNNCRKQTGSLFMANTFVSKKNLSLDPSGPGRPTFLRTYEDHVTDSGGTVSRSFCGNCGSSLFSENVKFPDGIIVAVGSLDLKSVGMEWKPRQELFTKNRESWLTVADESEEGNNGATKKGEKEEMSGFYRDDGRGLGDV